MCSVQTVFFFFFFLWNAYSILWLLSSCESHSVMSDSLRCRGLYSPWNSPGQNTGVGSFSLSPGDLPNPRIEPRSPALQVDSLPAEQQRKPKNTGVGSLSLLQCIILTQELNLGLLHCRQILYQWRYQGSPILWLVLCQNWGRFKQWNVYILIDTMRHVCLKKI